MTKITMMLDLAGKEKDGIKNFNVMFAEKATEMQALVTARHRGDKVGLMNSKPDL